jgi:hypothetical protein
MRHLKGKRNRIKGLILITNACIIITPQAREYFYCVSSHHSSLKRKTFVHSLFHKVSNPDVSLILMISWTNRHPDPHRRNHGHTVPWKRRIGKAQARQTFPSICYVFVTLMGSECVRELPEATVGVSRE